MIRRTPFVGAARCANAQAVLPVPVPPLCSVLIPVMLAPVAASQSVDDVHSIPRIDLEEAMPSGIKLIDSVLRHAKPLRADVDVVLVPVTRH